MNFYGIKEVSILKKASIPSLFQYSKFNYKQGYSSRCKNINQSELLFKLQIKGNNI